MPRPNRRRPESVGHAAGDRTKARSLTSRWRWSAGAPSWIERRSRYWAVSHRPRTPVLRTMSHFRWRPRGRVSLPDPRSLGLTGWSISMSTTTGPCGVDDNTRQRNRDDTVLHAMTEELRSESLVTSGEDNLDHGMPRRDEGVAAEDELEIGARIGWKLEDDPRPPSDRPDAGWFEPGPTVPQKSLCVRARDERHRLADRQQPVGLLEPDRVKAGPQRSPTLTGRVQSSIGRQASRVHEMKVDRATPRLESTEAVATPTDPAIPRRIYEPKRVRRSRATR